jgi:hypothetical protein
MRLWDQRGRLAELVQCGRVPLHREVERGTIALSLAIVSITPRKDAHREKSTTR